MNLNLIVAMQKSSRGIGFQNGMPWRYREDLRRFSKLTKGDGKNAVIMGRNTWESLPVKPLPGRKNIVLSTTLCRQDVSLAGDELYFGDADSALRVCKESGFDAVWVIGGERVYREFISLELVDRIFVTLVPEPNLEFDTFFPEIPSCFELVAHEGIMDEGRPIYFQEFKARRQDTQ